MTTPDRAMPGQGTVHPSGARWAVFGEPRGSSHAVTGPGRSTGRRVVVVIGQVRLHTIGWGALWFLVVVSFTAGVGVIQAAGAAGAMPPLTSSVEAVVGDPADDPSSAPSVDVVRSD